jgi:hypothetical protein
VHFFFHGLFVIAGREYERSDEGDDPKFSFHRLMGGDGTCHLERRLD